MPITLTISTSSLNLMASDCKQVRMGRGWAGFGQAGILRNHPRSCWGRDAPCLSRECLDGLSVNAHLPPRAEEVGGISHVLCGIFPGDSETQVSLPGARSGFDPTPDDVPVLFLVFCGS